MIIVYQKSDDLYFQSLKKPPAKEAFLMVPLDEGAVHLELWLIADAQDLGRFSSASSNFASLVSRTYFSPVSPITYYSIQLKKPPAKEAFLMVPLVRIGLTTPSLPMTCSTPEL